MCSFKNEGIHEIAVGLFAYKSRPQRPSTEPKLTTEPTESKVTDPLEKTIAEKDEVEEEINDDSLTSSLVNLS